MNYKLIIRYAIFAVLIAGIAATLYAILSPSQEWMDAKARYDRQLSYELELKERFYEAGTQYADAKIETGKALKELMDTK